MGCSTDYLSSQISAGCHVKCILGPVLVSFFFPFHMEVYFDIPSHMFSYGVVFFFIFAGYAPLETYISF